MSKTSLTSRRTHRLAGATHIPWIAPADWTQANQALQHLCTRHQSALAPARKTARKLQCRLEALFPLLDDLCGRTCAACPEPCCHVATVWFDFQDLVFIHLSGQVAATAQLTRTADGTCRCCGPTGCRLPRLSRPWTCAWYLCPPQKYLLAGMPAETRAQFETSVTAVKKLRIQMESEFIGVTT
jgi:hypothetical protein